MVVSEAMDAANLILDVAQKMKAPEAPGSALLAAWLSLRLNLILSLVETVGDWLGSVSLPAFEMRVLHFSTLQNRCLISYPKHLQLAVEA